MEEIKAQPQYWFQMEPRPTEELMQVWKRRRIDPEPGIDLVLVEQVLIARHVLTPSFPADTANSSFGAVRDSFIIRELTGDRNDGKWEVNLSNTLAEFINVHGREWFVINRGSGRLEVQFQHGGFMMMSETSSALVRGKTFDFGKSKPLLEAWLPPLTREDLQKDLKFRGWVMALAGAISLLQATFAGIVLGGLFVVLSLVNILSSWRGMFIINGILLLGAGGFSLYGLFDSLNSLTGSISFVTAFWAFLSLFELLWGYQEFHKFKEFRPK